MGLRSRLTILGVAIASHAVAQPITQPEQSPVLALIRDDKQLAEALTAIAQDPAVKVDDEKMRPLAQALMTEGVRQLQANQYDQALANFLEAYSKLPSPKILLNIASTLRDMGRLADAANTYQRYLTDPATSAERVAEVKELLLRLDEQLTILTVRVFPRGSEVSIDAGPFIPVGSSLLTRVRPGLHLVRIRNAGAANEIPVNGFEGETKDVTAAVANDAMKPDKTPPEKTPPEKTPPDKTPPDPTATPDPNHIGNLPIDRTAPDKVEGWLITGTQYGTENANGRDRTVHAGFTGPVVAPIVPRYETSEDNTAIVHYPDVDHIGSGVIGIMRVDPKLRGAAGGLGFAWVPRDELEVELAVLKSDVWGGYVGMRYRFLTGWFRPYVGAGAPTFFYKDYDMKSRVSPGVRGASGIELVINGHLSVQGDLGFEHFFNVANSRYENDANLFVPTIGVIGRM